MVGNSLFKKGSNSNFLYLLALVMSIPTVDGLFLSRIFSAWVSFNDLFFDLGFGSRVQVLFPRMQCTLRVINLGFDPFNYDRYNRYL